jgi:hypothetical protein
MLCCFVLKNNYCRILKILIRAAVTVTLQLRCYPISVALQKADRENNVIRDQILQLVHATKVYKTPLSAFIEYLINHPKINYGKNIIN